MSHGKDSTHHDLCYSSHGACAGTRKTEWVKPRRFDPTAQAPYSSAQTNELNSCINPNSKVKVSFCKDVCGDRGSIFYGGQNTTLLDAVVF